MIDDYPKLVKFFASSNPVHLLLFVLPLWVLSFYLMSGSSTSGLTLVLSFLGGVLYWSFLEYAIHRWLYHSKYPTRALHYFLGSFHLYHHRNMGDHRVLTAGFLMIYLMTPLVLSPLLYFTQDPGVFGAATLGLTAFYYFYEWIHYTLHYKVHQSGYLNYIQKYHLHHHDRAPRKNFGNTSHLWDVVLGTYDPSYADYQMPLSTRDTLITLKLVLADET